MLTKKGMRELSERCTRDNKFLLLVYSEDYWGMQIVGYKVYDYPPSMHLLQYVVDSPENWLEFVKYY